ncbi:MAG: DUF2254 domain-containing protein [Xanthobacteraceae bacterium]
MLPTTTQISAAWERLRTNFWFLPSLMGVVAVAVSFALIQLDLSLGVDVVRELGWTYTFGAEGARAILSAIASSMITVAALTFSMTMLSLQLASSQFGPRLLRNFMRDRVNQAMLGIFIATFVYCLLVLRTVRGTDTNNFVPHISVAFGVFLAIASLAMLIYFIHHIALAIRIETLLAEIAAEVRASIDKLYPEDIGQENEEKEPVAQREQSADGLAADAKPIRAGISGYVQSVDADALMEVATACDLLVRIATRPGRFVLEDDVIMTASPADRVSEETVADLCATLIIGRDRTPTQDIEFSIRRIVEIAQRALSPGLNDPTTAIYCLDRLAEVFARLATRSFPLPWRRDDEGRLRVVTEPTTLEELVCPAFAAVARYGTADADVMTHLLAIMRMVAQRTSANSAAAILALANEIERESRQRALFKPGSAWPSGPHGTSAELFKSGSAEVTDRPRRRRKRETEHAER